MHFPKLVITFIFITSLLKDTIGQFFDEHSYAMYIVYCYGIQLGTPSPLLAFRNFAQGDFR